MNFDTRNETARGYMLLLVFYAHFLAAEIGVMPDPSQAPLTFAELKIFAPHVGAFFFLSGMLAPAIGQKTLRAVLPQSIMLIALGWVSQIIGMLIGLALYGTHATALGFAKSVIKPLILGTGDCTYVVWFFTVLAVTRLLAWTFQRHRLAFLVAWLAIFAAVQLAGRLHLPDNLWEWRYWPMATFLTLAGMRVPRHLMISNKVGLAALAGVLLLTWFNAPGALTRLPCLTCDLAFIGFPEIGSFGSLPLFVAGDAAFILLVLWAAQKTLAPAPGRLLRYVGQNSAQMLLLEGWFITAFFPWMTAHLPAHESLAFMTLYFILSPLVHAGLFRLLRVPVNRILASCFSLGRHATALLLGGAAAPARRPARPIWPETNV